MISFSLPPVARRAASRLAPIALALSLLAAANAQYLSHDDKVPSPRYSSTGDTQFENGSVMSFFDVFMLATVTPGPPISPPIDSFFDVFVLATVTPGPPGTGPGRMHLRIGRPDPNNASFFDIFVDSMTFSGLPAVQLRESPTLPSVGQIIIDPIPGTNDFMVSSFFDIFTELSVDGGTTWSPALGSTHMVGAPVPEPASMAVLGLGVLALLRRRRKG